MDKDQPGPSKKRQRTKEYFDKMRQNQIQFDRSGLHRPQEAFDGLKYQTRQVNAGTLVIPNPPERTPSEDIPTFMTSSRANSAEDNENSDPTFGTIKPKWILDEGEFMEFYDQIRQCKEFALDTEGHNYDSKYGFVAILQVGTWEFGDFILGAYEVRAQILEFLKPILEDPGVLKVVHGGVNDYLWLQRDFGIFMRRILDTQIMHEIRSGERQVSFKDLVHQYTPEMTHLLRDKTLSDWRLRPGKGLTVSQEVYAACDVHISLRIMDRLRAKFQLESESRGLQESFRKCVQEIESKSYEVPSQSVVPTVEDISVNWRDRVKELNVTDRERLNALLEWRHFLASWVDTKDGTLMRTPVLISLVKAGSALKDVESITKITGSIESSASPVSSSEKSRQSSQSMSSSSLSSVSEMHSVSSQDSISVSETL